MVYLYWAVLVAAYSVQFVSTQYNLECGINNIYSGSSKYIAIPYPLSAGYSCHWRIVATVNTYMVLECTDFDLERNASGCIDTFQFSPSGQLINADEEILCGFKEPFNLYTTSNYFDAYFTSEPHPAGFSQLSYSRLECSVTAYPEYTYKHDCGKNNLPTRIVGGVEVENHEWPWQVALRSFGRLVVNYNLITIKPHTHFCGGSLISPKWVLTAAQCIWDLHKDQFYVSIGAHDTETGGDTQFTVQRYIVKIIIHENYLPTHKLIDDIAVIELEYPVDYSHGIRPICLPQPLIFIYENVTVTGWGRTSTYGPGSSKLLETNLTVIPGHECGYTDNDGFIVGEIGKDHICASGGDKNICTGDLGSPLVWLDGRGRYQQIGIAIATKGWECAEKTGKPSLFTRVTTYKGWIQANTLIDICYIY